MTQSLTMEFGAEFEVERTRLLRRRLMWYCGVSLALNLLTLVLGVRTFQFQGDIDVSAQMRIIDLVLRYGGIIAYGAVLLWVWRSELSQQTILRTVHILVGGLGGFTLLLMAVLFMLLPREALMSGEVDGEAVQAPESLRTLLVGVMGPWTIFATHFFAALFIPWSPREAVRPLIVLTVAFAIALLFLTDGPIWMRLAFIPGGAIAGTPGLLIAWWRHSRLRQRFHLRALRGRYGEMKRELIDARRIHESLFPAPVRDGSVHFDYRYEPMRQIGGDFLYAHQFPGLPEDDAPAEPLSVVIIDVTGHGIPAALTVNRLHGELERLFAEEPDVGPGDVLTALNSYVHYTLASHSVYATALCLRVDPTSDELLWASGGHPPAFLCTVDGRMERLESTAFVLGACHGDDFQPGEQRSPFAPGDLVLAYTDGATEARDAKGRMLRVDGLQRVIFNMEPTGRTEGAACEHLLRMIEHHRYGPAADDTLIVELARPANVARRRR